ncbi:alpha/beta fold hydrolase [Leucothrix pacifica]|uniref:Alpha/beta hydrolase n=1 Tax=Leucothrix pacifica TaxID=1247513 RepID=A0A317CR57_9GAMM|nr:alpha/beta hydrolase [Leucothrix pacifica]PWR00668.1 alpha/beta hydrolase [Leucothrix pacifica]
MKQIHQISYTERGEQHTGIPIICLHGIGGSQDSFLPQLEALSNSHRTIAWNMPGYGESALLETTSFTTLTQALLGFMDELGIEKAHILGHSIGGMIAQEVALTNPDRVASLALLGTTPSFGGRDDSFKQRFLEARLKPLDDGQTMSELADEFVPQIVGSQADKAMMQAASDTMRVVTPEAYRVILQCLIQFDRYADSGLISQPCCLIAGSEDNNAPAKTMHKMASKIPNACFYELEQVGHLINLEAPKRCNQILNSFYTGLNNDQNT